MWFVTCTDIPSATRSRHPAIAVAERNIRKIKGKFSMLVTRSRRKLQYRGINIEDVQTFLITMYSSPKSSDGSDMVTTVLESATSLDGIFRALSKHGLWDYLNYFLLQSIIEEFASDDDELNGMMEEYQKDLTGHILTLQIQTYLDASHYECSGEGENMADEIASSSPPHQLFQKLSVKVDANVTDHSLNYVNDLWRSLANQILLPKPAMILHNIAEGCVGIMWLIPANLVEHVSKMAQETSTKFAEQNILNVMLEEQCIYPMNTEPPPLESESAGFKRKVWLLNPLN